MLALPLTAAVLLHATPTQMGVLTAMEVLPFVLFSLPAGVYLDRVRKLPVYVWGELLLALFVASVPLAWWAGWLSMAWLYFVGFAIGTRVHDRRQRGADRPDADRAARAAGRGPCEERVGEFLGRGGRPGTRGRPDQAGRGAVRAAGRCRAADDLGADPARHPRHRRAAATSRAISGRPCGPACASSPGTGCW